MRETRMNPERCMDAGRWQQIVVGLQLRIAQTLHARLNEQGARQSGAPARKVRLPGFFVINTDARECGSSLARCQGLSQ
jgi:hypothetical protein